MRLMRSIITPKGRFQAQAEKAGGVAKNPAGMAAGFLRILQAKGLDPRGYLKTYLYSQEGCVRLGAWI